MSLSTRLTSELKGDRAIWAVIFILSVFSIAAVYSSTSALAYNQRGGNTEIFLLKQFVLLVGGLFLTYMFHLLHYTRYSKAAPYLIIISIPLLMYTIAFGAELNDARRWIRVPVIELTFQTSEFAKIALITYVARAISSKQEYIKDFQSAFLPIIMPILIICGLIAPADLSTAILLFFSCVIMMFIGRVALQYIGLLLTLGVVLFTILVTLGEFFPNVIRRDTWTNRVRDFIENPDGEYQIQQAKIAIANGKVLGLGPGRSIQKNYLPAPYSDFIYSIICEEYGFMGGVVIILLYVFFFFRTTRLITNSPKAFGAMLVMGLSTILVIQAFTNIAVNLHLVPVTGLTLPLISMGGTSVLFTCISFGMILSVSKYLDTIS